MPTEVPTQRLGDAAMSLFLDRESQKCKEEMTSRDSLSILVTLELRERLKEISLASVSMPIKGVQKKERQKENTGLFNINM